MAVITEIPKVWASYKKKLPDGYTVITAKEALKSPDILKAARVFIDRNVKGNAPIGKAEFKTIGGRKILFIVEPHYHPPGGAVKPWGWHKGATVHVPPAGDYWAFLYDDSSSPFAGESIDAIKTNLQTFATLPFKEKMKRIAPDLITGAAFLISPIAGGATIGARWGFKKLKAAKVAKEKLAKPVSPTPSVHADSPMPDF